jgi:hypothetical protein
LEEEIGDAWGKRDAASYDPLLFVKVIQREQ